MPSQRTDWSLLVYKLPPQPTRLRIQIWRKLQAIGAVYVQDGVAALPSREDLDENLSYIASSIEEMEGTALLLRATGLNPSDERQMIERFRGAADSRMTEIAARIESLADLPEVPSLEALQEAEDALKRERSAYLKARRLSYFGSEAETRVEAGLDSLRVRIEDYLRGGK